MSVTFNIDSIHYMCMLSSANNDQVYTLVKGSYIIKLIQACSQRILLLQIKS